MCVRRVAVLMYIKVHPACKSERERLLRAYATPSYALSFSLTLCACIVCRDALCEQRLASVRARRME